MKFCQMSNWLSTLLSALAAVLLLGVLGCESPGTSPAPKEPAQPSAKSKLGLVVLSDIRSEGTHPTVEAISAKGTRTIKKGDALQLGERIRCGKATEAEIRFDSGTRVLLEENASLLPAGHPTVTGVEGRIAISRQVGAPVPFVLEFNGHQYSVIQGKTLVVAEDGEGVLEVQSGEVLRLDNNQYLGAGERVTQTKTSMPKDAADSGSQGQTADVQKPLVLPAVPADWSPSIAPMEKASVIAMTPEVARGIGTLVARNPRTGKTAQNAMKMNAHLVTVRIQEGVAITEVEERFTNLSNATVEATYRFLVPAAAEITRLALDVNGRIEEGEVLEKKRAAKIFKQIVDDAVRPRDPALLEWEQGSAFKMKIFPIKAKETRRVFLTYTMPLTSASGYYRYEYPLANPRGSVDVEELTVNAVIQARSPLRNLRTPLYASKISGNNTQQAQIAWQSRNEIPQHDFVITFDTDNRQSGLRSLVQTEKNGQSYGMFLWQPGTEMGQIDRTVKDVRGIVAMVDVSYGTSREMIELSAATLVEMLGGLSHTDRFNVLACDSSCKPLFPNFQEPSAAALQQMYRELTAIEPGGASNLLGNFQQAFALVREASDAVVVYLGDGIATSGEMDSHNLISLLAATRPMKTRVHTVGIGPSIDAKMLGRMAAELNGMNYNLSFGESPGSASWQLSKMFTSDALTNVRVQLTDSRGRRWPLYPEKVGFLPAGQELQLLTRLDYLMPGQTAAATVDIEATRLDGTPVQKRYSVALEPGAPGVGFVSRLWAAGRIGDLEFNGGSEQDIVEVSRLHRVASRLTSWIVLENQRMYDIFNVQRTDGEQYDGDAVSFVEAKESADESESESGPFEDLSEMRVDELGLGISGIGSGAGGAGMSAPKRSSASAKKSMPAARDEAPAMEMAAPMVAEQRPVRADKKSSIAHSDPLSNDLVEIPRRSRPICSGPRFQVDISEYRNDSNGARNKAERLQTQLASQPLSRTLHRQYVRQLTRMDNRQAAEAASSQWRSSDPYSADALQSFAAEVQRQGNRELAIRLYDSSSEVSPGHQPTHRRLAQMQRDLGNYAAAAGHYRAAFTTSTKGISRNQQEDDILGYFFSLVLSGQHPLFLEEFNRLQSFIGRGAMRTRVEELRTSLQTGIVPEWQRNTAKGALQVSLENTSEDLDVLLIDPFGRVQSGLWRFGADVADYTSKSSETLWSAAPLLGQYQVVVVRTGTDGGGPATGTVTIRLKGEQRRISFNLENTSQTIAAINYQRLPDKRCYAW